MALHNYILEGQVSTFRKEVDPWCEYEPKLFKYDGTHVVISVKYMRLNNPVTTTGDHSVQVTPLHKN